MIKSITRKFYLFMNCEYKHFTFPEDISHEHFYHYTYAWTAMG